MKKTTYFFFLSLFLISSLSGFSQVTLYSEDFETNSITETFLNDSPVNATTLALRNAHNITGDDLKLWNNPSYYTPADCNNDKENWVIHTGGDNGSAPSGMINKRAGIEDYGYWCYQEQSLITPTWTATRTIMTITFSYSYNDGNWDSLIIDLQHRSGGASFADVQELVNEDSDGNASVNYASGEIVVIPGDDYRLVFTFKGSYDHGAAVDTIEVLHPDLTVSADKTISNSRTYDDITVDAGRTLTISEAGDLTVNTSITNNGTIVLESGASAFAVLISKAASTTITYKRYVNVVGASNWDLIGSPVTGQTFSGFVTANAGDLATNGSGPVEYAIGLFDSSDNTWDNYDANTVGSDPFLTGKGYAVASVNGETLEFTGTTLIVDQTQAIEDNDAASSGAGSRWDLIANPFPSFINGNNDAHATINFLTVNTAKLDDTYEAIYGYDGDGTGYTGYGHDHLSNTAIYIAPGQGFFVASSSDDPGTVSFTEEMQSISGGDDFIAGASGDTMDPVNTLFLRLYYGDDNIEETKIKFQENMTVGLDPGYDLGSFYQNAAIMTRLVDADQGTGFQDQQLPLSLMDDVVIPLEINQTAGQEFRINLHTSSIGEVNIYLEDTELETLTLLNEEDFVLTPTYDLSDSGRFFIHTTENALSNEEVNTSILNAYKEVDNNYITIEGLATQVTSTEVSLYNIIGTKVMDTSLDNITNTQTISTNGFATGIYVLKLVSGKNQLTKKLIIK